MEYQKVLLKRLLEMIEDNEKETITNETINTKPYFLQKIHFFCIIWRKYGNKKLPKEKNLSKNSLN